MTQAMAIQLAAAKYVATEGCLERWAHAAAHALLSGGVKNAQISLMNYTFFNCFLEKNCSLIQK